MIKFISLAVLVVSSILNAQTNTYSATIYTGGLLKNIPTASYVYDVFNPVGSGYILTVTAIEVSSGFDAGVAQPGYVGLGVSPTTKPSSNCTHQSVVGWDQGNTQPQAPEQVGSLPCSQNGITPVTIGNNILMGTVSQYSPQFSRNIGYPIHPGSGLALFESSDIQMSGTIMVTFIWTRMPCGIGTQPPC